MAAETENEISLAQTQSDKHADLYNFDKPTKTGTCSVQHMATAQCRIM